MGETIYPMRISIMFREAKRLNIRSNVPVASDSSLQSYLLMRLKWGDPQFQASMGRKVRETQSETIAKHSGIHLSSTTERSIK
jgi:hypothetical protein